MTRIGSVRRERSKGRETEKGDGVTEVGSEMRETQKGREI